MSASRRVLRLVSVVAKRREPNTCDSEVIVKVPCHRSAVDRKKPMRSIDQPPTSHLDTPSSVVGIHQCWLRKRRSGNFAKSLMRSHWVASYFGTSIHVMWLHRNPRLGEWTSCSMSEYL